MSRYVTVYPENLKAQYTEYDSIDFVLTFENMALVPNSLKIQADLAVYSDALATTRITDTNVRIDGKVGAHSFISSITTDFQQSGTIENFQEYPRYCRMVHDATLRANDLNNSEAVCELKAPDDFLANLPLQGISQSYLAPLNPNNLDADFSIKPRFCLNNMSGALNYSKSGTIRVNVKLARNAAALYLTEEGSAAGLTTANYVLRNIRLCYMTEPAGQSGKVSMRTKLNIKQAVLSSFANISTKVPAVCNAVSCSFQKQTSENNIKFNNSQTEVLPLVDELQFLFNDSQNEYITFVIKDRIELLKRYIESFVNTGTNGASLKNLAHNNSYGIGLAFNEFIDFSSQKFNVQLNSAVNSNEPYTLYMYFHSMVTM